MIKTKTLPCSDNPVKRNGGANVTICRCEEVTEEEILEVISNGAVTVNEVKKRTRAGMGLCQGRSCGRLVQKLICEHSGLTLAHVKPGEIRPPVRPLPLLALVSSDDCTDK
ncbi:MAG: (2Fe-2S)-binding protein [Planctomycetes bacterium]|nr:(2Fe-2S)-binding protein [Planctomycetota bacterium]